MSSNSTNITASSSSSGSGSVIIIDSALCDGDGPGAIDWINNACHLPGVGEHAMYVIYIISIIWFALITLYTIYRGIGIIRVACRPLRSVSHAPHASAAYNVNRQHQQQPHPQAAPAPQHIPATLAASNTRDLSHLRLPTVLALTLGIGSIFGMITSILHVQGQRISVDAGVTITSALSWGILWLGGHSFLW
jgi:hypothetical protein